MGMLARSSSLTFKANAMHPILRVISRYLVLLVAVLLVLGTLASLAGCT